MSRDVVRYTILWVAVAAAQATIYILGGLPTVYLVNQAFVATGATAFTIVYHVTARWWESAMGRNIMLLVGSIAAILDMGLVFNILGRPEWMRFVFVGLFFAIGVAIWRRLTILIDVQHHSPDLPKPPRATI